MNHVADIIIPFYFNNTTPPLSRYWNNDWKQKDTRTRSDLKNKYKKSVIRTIVFFSFQAWKQL